MHTQPRFLQNLFGLYGLYFSGYLLALVSVPYLARVLGPAGWGLLAMVQAFSGCLLICIDFGFSFTASRDVAANRHDNRIVAATVSTVLVARVMLTVLCVCLAGIVQWFIPAFWDNGLLFWSGMFWAAAQGNTVLWYFQAIEAADRIAAIDLVTKSAATVAIFIVVRSTEDAWLFFVLHGSAALCTFAIGAFVAFKDLPLRVPAVTNTLNILWRSAMMFLPRNAWLLFSASNAFVLGLFVPVSVVGWYSAAERINRALLGLLGPGTEAVLARISRSSQSADEIRSVVWRSSLTMFGVGLTGSVAVFVTAPRIIEVLLGPGYDPAVQILRLLTVLFPLLAINNALGTNLLIPMGRERVYAAIVLAGGIVNIALACVLSSRMHALGAAWAAVLSHALLAGAVIVAAARSVRARTDKTEENARLVNSHPASSWPVVHYEAPTHTR